MSSNEIIERLVVEAFSDPLDAKKNFDIAVEYEKLGQTASAVGFYLRAAEYGYETEPLIAYASLLRISICIEGQKDRRNTVSNVILQAIAHLPKRPEAYFLLSRFYEKDGNWQECYTYATIGLMMLDNPLVRLPIDIDGYHGDYSLEFQVAISAWWIGRKDESIKILLRLEKQNLVREYKIAVKNNLRKIGINLEEIDPLEPVVTNYRKFFGVDAPIIIDIGTRDGDDAKYLSDRLNGITVIAVDASVKAVELTKKLHPWMIVEYTAISNFDGETTFYQVNSDNKELAGCSSMASKENTMYPKDFIGIIDKVIVPVTRMDTFLSNIGIDGIIDVVKIDTEGFSGQVIEGFGDRLKHVKLLHVETETNPTHDNHILTAEITVFMKNQGFVLVDIYYEWGSGIQDQIWVNPNLAIRNQEFFNVTV